MKTTDKLDIKEIEYGIYYARLYVTVHLLQPF